MGHALGPFCVSTQRGDNQPFLDSAATQVEKWGDKRHGAICVTIRRRMFVLTVRGTRPSSWDRLARPRLHWRLWRHRNDARPVGGGAQSLSALDPQPDETEQR